MRAGQLVKGEEKHAGHLKGCKLRVRWNIVGSCGVFLDEEME